ncbi:MAG TPA: hypothetical protein VFY84_19830 [Jiangellales bacterium]|nr:hypothetical protein [Jiangellales bacterium]
MVTEPAGVRNERGLRAEQGLPIERLDAVVFSLDGVLVDPGPASAGTASGHLGVSMCRDALALIRSYGAPG